MLFSRAPVVSQPRLVIDEGTLVRFGSVYAGESPQKRITLTNTGTEAVRIRNYESSCGCTVARLGSLLIRPGRSVPMTIRLQTSELEGQVAKEVTIRWNNPRDPNLVVSILADVRPIVSFSRSVVEFDSATVGKIIAETVLVRNLIRDTVRIRSWSSSDVRVLSASSDSLLPPLATAKLVLTLKPAAAGRFSGNVEGRFAGRSDVVKSLGCRARVGR